MKEEDGGKQRYKAIIVVKGFAQKKDIDFDEIFSLVVKMTSIITILSVVVEIYKFCDVFPDSPNLTIKSTVKYKILLLNSLRKLNRQLQTHEEKSSHITRFFYWERLKLKTPTIIYYVYQWIMKQSHTNLSS